MATSTTLLGKPKIEVKPAGSGKNWTELDTPVEGSTSLETSEGTDLEAREEGGEVVDRISSAASYTLTFELFKKEGVALPFADTSGVVDGEWAVKVSSALRSNAPSFQIDRAVLKTSVIYTVNDTLRKRYTFSALKPISGDTLKIMNSDGQEDEEANPTSPQQ